MITEEKVPGEVSTSELQVYLNKQLEKDVLTLKINHALAEKDVLGLKLRIMEIEKEMKKLTMLNLNDCVKVKLTEEGLKIYKGKMEAMNASLRKGTENAPQFSTEPSIDENGYSKFPLWELMYIFGEKLYCGCAIPFEENSLCVESIGKSLWV